MYIYIYRYVYIYVYIYMNQKRIRMVLYIIAWMMKHHIYLSFDFYFYQCTIHNSTSCVGLEQCHYSGFGPSPDFAKQWRCFNITWNADPVWLVVWTPSKTYESQLIERIIPNRWKNRNYAKSPTSCSLYRICSFMAKMTLQKGFERVSSTISSIYRFFSTHGHGVHVPQITCANLYPIRPKFKKNHKHMYLLAT